MSGKAVFATDGAPGRAVPRVEGFPGRLRLSFSSFRGSYGARMLLLLGVYYAAAHLGYALAFSGPVAAIVWLPVGVGIAGLYRLGLRCWPAVVLGDLLVNNYAALPVGAAIGQSFGNLLEVVLGVLILRRLVPREAPLGTATGVAGAFAAFVAGTLVSATIGTFFLFIYHVIAAHSVVTVWRTWWLGDFCGAAIVVPLVLAFSTPSRHSWLRGHAVEGALMLAALIGLSVAAARIGGPASYIAFPVLIWAAFRFGPRGATVAIAISAAFTIWGATSFLGPFTVKGGDSIPAVQIYLAVAALAALAVAALASERQALADSVHASRTRIFLTAAEERRRLERNLHDGAQGRLVALAAKLGLAAREARREPGTAAASFEAAQSELLAAIDELRDLVHGLHPAELRQFGLATAVEDMAAKSVIPIEVVELPRMRLDEATEAMAFYVVREAVTNAQRYSQASEIRVRIRQDGTWVTVEIEDDGIGGAAELSDHGVQGLRDRVEAAGGRFALSSDPGRGTRITARVAPIPAG